MPHMRLDKQLDRLYGLPLTEFTRARNDLARELSQAGEREAADEVKQLRKPSLSAWTVNQLARKERLQVRSLVTAAERLQTAQAKLLRGGSRDELREAVQRHREVVGALLESAKGVLRSAGQPATEATLERIRETLTAVAGHDEGMRLVREGRLWKDLDPAGFGPLTLGTDTGTKPSPPGKRTTAPAARKREESERKGRIEAAKREVDALRAEVAERKARARRATSEARRAERAAEAAKETAEREEAELERLTARVETAKKALERSRSG
jgi:hypothetical protein